MEINYYARESLLLEKTSSENEVTYFKRDLSCINTDPSKEISIIEFFASSKKAIFSCKNSSQYFYIIVGELSFETDSGERFVASGGDIVQVPRENTNIKIFTNKYGKALRIQ